MQTQDVRVGDNNSYKTENTRKQRKPTVGVTCQPPIIPSPTVVSPCFLVFSVVYGLMFPTITSCFPGN